MTVKKHLRARNRRAGYLPCIYLVDSEVPTCQIRTSLPDQDHFGRIFYNQARMSAKGILRSPCHGLLHQGCLCSAMSDRSIIVRDQGTIFLGGPLGEGRNRRDRECRRLGARSSQPHLGVTDHMAEDDTTPLSLHAAWSPT